MLECKKLYQYLISEKMSIRTVSKKLGIPKSTVSDYYNRILVLNLTVEEINNLSENELQTMIFPKKEQKSKYPIPDFKENTLRMKQKGTTLYDLHQEYLNKYSTGYSYSQYCALYSEWKKKKRIPMQQSYVPGEKLYIDYAGTKISITNPETGEVSKYPLFVSALGFSSLIYAELVKSEGQIDFANATVNNFKYLQGVPKCLVPDNLKSAVIKASLYDPVFNPCYLELADFYGTDIEPARVRKPQDKAKAENAVLIATRWIIRILNNMVIHSIQEANIIIKELLENINNKVMRQYGKSRIEIYNEYERDSMLPLKSKDYIPRRLERHLVSIKYHIAYNNRYYSVPYEYIGKYVILEITSSKLNIFYENTLIAVHDYVKQIYDKSSNPEHMPNAHKNVFEVQTCTKASLLIKAEQCGYYIKKVVEEIIETSKNNIFMKKKCISIINSTKNYNKEEYEAAAKYFLQIKEKKTEVFKLILKNKVYNQEITPKNDTHKENDNSLSLHQNIRGAKEFK